MFCVHKQTILAQLTRCFPISQPSHISVQTQDAVRNEVVHSCSTTSLNWYFYVLHHPPILIYLSHDFKTSAIANLRKISALSREDRASTICDREVRNSLVVTTPIGGGLSRVGRPRGAVFAVGHMQELGLSEGGETGSCPECCCPRRATSSLLQLRRCPTLNAVGVTQMLAGRRGRAGTRRPEHGRRGDRSAGLVCLFPSQP
ncbi:hypothetical protein OH76DRAFT_184976 [Lentinus brumalis]|uniref:Uncharacterized protein n=1 Tax=Lentinus brumalis TaxID=2498619 RepID=A0A371CN43_9APHY|nr:hypothetical protein OH76DRAFT_184976 [Polyporus brumalis]